MPPGAKHCQWLGMLRLRLCHKLSEACRISGGLFSIGRGADRKVLGDIETILP